MTGEEACTSEQYPFRAGAIKLTHTKVPNHGPALQRAMEEVNELVRRQGPKTGRFRWVGVVIRLLGDDSQVEASADALVRRVTRDGELPVLIDTHTRELQGLDLDALVVTYKKLMLHSLVAGLKREELAHSFADDELRKLT